MPRPLTPDDVETMLEALERLGADMTGWEVRFVESLRKRQVLGLEFTELQLKTLVRIYRERVA